MLSFILILLFLFLTHQDCLNLCYTHNSAQAQCDICYYECSNSSEAYFTSCHYEDQLSGKILDLTESQCYSYCYPEMIHQLQALEDVSQKLKFAQAKTTSINTEMQHQITSQQLKKQIENAEHDTDLIIFAMASGCALFTLLVVIFIIKRFELKNHQKQKTDSKYFETQQKDLPDINVDSSSNYYPSNSQPIDHLNL